MYYIYIYIYIYMYIMYFYTYVDDVEVVLRLAEILENAMATKFTIKNHYGADVLRKFVLQVRKATWFGEEVFEEVEVVRVTLPPAVEVCIHTYIYIHIYI